jgi:hypothetical protein
MKRLTKTFLFEKRRRKEMKYGPWRQKADITIAVSTKLIFALTGRHHKARSAHKYLCKSCHMRDASNRTQELPMYMAQAFREAPVLHRRSVLVLGPKVTTMPRKMSDELLGCPNWKFPFGFYRPYG